MLFRALTPALALAALARAAPEPTSPDSSTVVNVGGQLTALWNKDATGTWTDMTIQLMTGANLAMVPLVTVGRDLDATSLDSYSFAVPEVTPNSAIYFLQFTSSKDPSETLWTTRFTIAGADGSTTEPTNATQADGSPIPWGTGTLVSSDDLSSTTTSASSASASASAADVSTAISTTTETSTTASSSTIRTVASSSSSAAATPAAAAAASTAAGSSAAGTSGAGVRSAVGGSVVAGAVAGLVGAVAAFL